jgi:transposase
MYYVGLDVHAKRSSLCILDGHGKPIKQLEVRGNWDKLLEAVAKLPRPMTIGYEASCGYGYLHGRLAQLAERVVVGHPGQMRLIFKSKRKHDRIDGQKIAKLLYLDAMPQVHVPQVHVPQVHLPQVHVREWRALINYRRKLVERRAAVKTQVRALLREHGITAAKGLFTKKGLAWLAQQAMPSPATALRREMMIDELAELSGKIARVERELARIAARHPGVALLRTIPGVGIRTAEAVVAWIDDVRRFARACGRSAATSAWCRARTAPATSIASGTSPRMARRPCASCCAKRRGRRCAAARRSESSSIASAAATPTAARSRSWPSHITCRARDGGDASQRRGVAGESLLLLIEQRRMIEREAGSTAGPRDRGLEASRTSFP